MILLRRRPLMRGAIIGGAAYGIGKRRARNQMEQQQAQADQQMENEQFEQHMAEEKQDQQGMKGGESDSGMDKITQLKKLHENGSLTDEEFTKAKAKVLNEI